MFLASLVVMLIAVQGFGSLGPSGLTQSSSIPHAGGGASTASGSARSEVIAMGDAHGSSAPAVFSTTTNSATSNSTALLTIRINSAVATESPNFWTVDVDGLSDPAVPVVAQLLNETPFKTLRYGDNWVDETNWTNGCFYLVGSACSPATGDPVEFGKLCQWLNDDCILGVPAETNSVSATTALVHWLASRTSWQPTCWAIGNEPQDWNHFNIPWTDWSTSDTRNASAAQFALDASNLTAAIRAIYPGACIIGLESNNVVHLTAPWTAAVVAGDPGINAVAIHAYPDNHCLGPYLAPGNLTSLATQYADAVSVADGLPVDLEEFNIGLGGCPALGSEAAAVFTSANVAQALEEGMPQFGFFHFYCGGPECMVDSDTGRQTSLYSLYSGLFTHMDIATIRNVTLSNGVDPETYAAVGSNNATDRSLLLSNAATSSWENVSLAGLTPSNWSGQVYAQGTTGRVTQAPYELGMTLALPPESTVVVQTYESDSDGGGNGSQNSTYSVRFAESGLPDGTAWAVTLDGVRTDSQTEAAVFSEPNGSYPYTVRPLSGYSTFPSSGVLGVRGAAMWQNLTFTPDSVYAIHFSETGLPAGSAWSVRLNNSTHSSLSGTVSFSAENGSYGYTVAPIEGYASSPEAGRVAIVGAAAHIGVVFALPTTFAVNFSEAGLTASSTWSVALNGTTVWSNSTALSYEAGSGSLPFRVSTDGKYFPSPAAGTVNVSGATTVSITFSSQTQGMSNGTSNQSGNSSTGGGTNSSAGAGGASNATPPPPSTGGGGLPGLASAHEGPSVPLLATCWGMSILGVALVVGGLVVKVEERRRRAKLPSTKGTFRSARRRRHF
jgi:hypothetical protein